MVSNTLKKKQWILLTSRRTRPTMPSTLPMTQQCPAKRIPNILLTRVLITARTPTITQKTKPTMATTLEKITPTKPLTALSMQDKKLNKPSCKHEKDMIRKKIKNDDLNYNEVEKKYSFFSMD